LLGEKDIVLYSKKLAGELSLTVFSLCSALLSRKGSKFSATVLTYPPRYQQSGLRHSNIGQPFVCGFALVVGSAYHVGFGSPIPLRTTRSKVPFNPD
jgi:hypothetical protein